MSTDPDTPLAHPHRSNLSIPWLIYLFVALLIIAFYSCAPGMATFGADEANILLRAYDANLTHRLARRGLEGSLGYPYGPAGIWFYQALLALTHNPLHIMQLHILLFTLTLALATASLARTTRLSPLAFLPALASPYVWFFSRHLWDNPLNIPLGMCAFAAFAAYLRNPRPFPLYLSIVLSGLTLLVHLMAAPLVAAMALYLLLSRAGDLRRHFPWLLLGVITVAILSSQYIPALLFDKPLDPIYAKMPTLLPWFYTLLGPRVLSATHLDAFFFLFNEHLPDPAGHYPTHARYLTSAGHWSTAFSIASNVTYIIYPLVWLPLLRCLPTFFLSFHRPSPAYPTPGSRSLPTELAFVAILTLAFQTLLLGLTHTSGAPAYYNGTFPAFVLLAALSFHYLLTLPLLKHLLTLHLLACLLCSSLLLHRISQTAGVRGPEYGPTLANQIQIFTTLQSLPTPPQPSLDTHGRIAWTGYLLLSFLYPLPTPPTPPTPTPPTPTPPVQNYDLIYTDPANPFSAHLSLNPPTQTRR